MTKLKTNFKVVVLLLLAFVLALAGLGTSAQPARAGACAKFHTVKKGEYLVQIGRIYGVHWRTLAEINNLKNPSLIFPGQRLCVKLEGAVKPTPKPVIIPTFNIVSVVRDKSVTIQTANFPADDRFDVLMGAFSTRGINGIKVESIKSGKGGTFKATFDIPAALRGSYRIAIRLQSSTGSGYFAYNWFFNNTTDGTPGTTPPPGYSGFPTFFIVSVVRDTSVTIKTNNLPPNDKFDVLMNYMSTRGVSGIKVDTLDSGKGGTLTATFKVPASLNGLRQIAIRLQSPTSGYFAYNWFYNNTTP